MPLGDPLVDSPKKLGFKWMQAPHPGGWFSGRKLPKMEGGSSPGGLVVEFSPKTQNAKKTVLKAGTLKAGESYYFQLLSYQVSAPALNNTAYVTINVG